MIVGFEVPRQSFKSWKFLVDMFFRFLCTCRTSDFCCLLNTVMPRQITWRFNGRNRRLLLSKTNKEIRVIKMRWLDETSINFVCHQAPVMKTNFSLDFQRLSSFYSSAIIQNEMKAMLYTQCHWVEYTHTHTLSLIFFLFCIKRVNK